ncbi:DUF2993 domain-containing protein [Streptomyces sp. J2-1]|uniref:LmeA family phospholipid-binding protein n=1 Tax=Streptomyces corallincola TaxID=2851888 RepID=UPI001C385A08|nr:DUF2993 domain-containing protein [Streptomyces corallincola]MBV2356832.1 DUF2993 domain-containing protein [Streptomyces corallincola]
MRALRILLILVVLLGVLFVIVDRVGVRFAEGKVADRLKTSENLSATPSVDIKGFPFLTQVAGGSLDDVEVGIKEYEAATGTDGKKLRIDDLTADMKGVSFSGDYSSATAADATGSATVSYAELLKAAQIPAAQVAPGVTAQVVGLSDGGNGKIKVAVDATVLGNKLPRPLYVLSSVAVKDGKVQVRADSLPAIAGAALAEGQIRRITDFQQAIDGLPGGIALDKVEPMKTGVRLTVTGTDVRLAG